MPIQYKSRRSVIQSSKGVVSSTQPLATAAGLKVLEKGGNAAMAAVATAAVLALLEPHMTGPGGDMFALNYSASDQKVRGINGSGRAPAKSSLEKAKEQGLKGVLGVTVPGAVKGWCDVVDNWGNGKLTMQEVLEPAISMARNGVPVSEISSQIWKDSVKILDRWDGTGKSLLNAEGKAPETGEVFKNEGLAKTYELIGELGWEGFYKGVVGDAIVDTIKNWGGYLEKEDLETHESTLLDEALSVVLNIPVGKEKERKNLRIHEIPPNGQGFVALQTLVAIRAMEKQGLIKPIESYEHNSVEYLHILIEALKIGFRHADDYICDLSKNPDIDVLLLLSDKYLAQEVKEFSMDKASPNYLDDRGGVVNPILESDTVYLTAADEYGNACSFINSIYGPFGSGIVPNDLGFVLQNRGGNFNLHEGSRNVLEGGKRPYHVRLHFEIAKFYLRL